MLRTTLGKTWWTFDPRDDSLFSTVYHWLIAAKGVNLAALLALRSFVLRRFYPQSKTF